jgi:hypothetical protein
MKSECGHRNPNANAGGRKAGGPQRPDTLLNPTAACYTQLVMTQHFRRVHLTVLLILAGLCGCSATTRHGDATLHTKRPLYGPPGHRTWWLELPEVSLAQASAHRFQVRGLPSGLLLRYRLTMDVPEADRHKQDISSAPWRQTRVALTVRDAHNQTIAQRAVTLGDLFARNGFGAGNGEDLPVISNAAASVQDFDIEIRIESPSPRPRDRMRIIASATTNDRAPKAPTREQPVPHSGKAG